MIKSTETFDLIHIGKCGGGTLSCVLHDRRHIYNHVHLRCVPFNPEKKYIIMLRNPIKRFISAFNWRYRLVIKERVAKRYDGEKDALMHYGSVNNLAENIFDASSPYNINDIYIHHIKEDIFYHLGKFVTECKRENILGVLTLESLNADIKELFGADNPYNIHKNEGRDCFLSDLGYANLKKYLHKDYECIEKLYQLGVISAEKYAVLSV